MACDHARVGNFEHASTAGFPIEVSANLALPNLGSVPRGHFTTPALAADCSRFLSESQRRAKARTAATDAAHRFRA